MGLLNEIFGSSPKDPWKEARQQKQEKEVGDANEGQKFVCQGGKISCTYCSIPEADIIPTSSFVQLQDKPWATIGDCDGKINFDFKGVCNHPSQQKVFSPPPPCKSIINLGKWKNHSYVDIDDYKALLVKSTIPCQISGEDLRITHSGQYATLEEVKPKISPPLLNINLLTKDVKVCVFIECEAIWSGHGKEPDPLSIRWKVQLKSKDNSRDVKLEQVKLEGVDRSNLKLIGHKISFPVPKEWGQKSVSFTAYAMHDPENRSKPLEIAVKDHIVAAFYRVPTENPQLFDIEGVNVAAGTGNILPAPVHHHQGLYKAEGHFYITGSTERKSPSYSYLIRSEEDGSHTHSETLLFDQGMHNYYRHPGGLQIANGILAVGLEAYNYRVTPPEGEDVFKFSKWGLMGSAVNGNSIVCFFKLGEEGTSKRELINLRIIRDVGYKGNLFKGEIEPLEEEKESFNNQLIEDDNDLASAVGILCLSENSEKESARYLVAVRGSKQSIQFYICDETTGSRPLGEKVEFVGEFQNMNLFLDEANQIYLFGMADRNVCSIFRVDIAVELLRNGNIEPLENFLKAVWIENGLIVEVEKTAGNNKRIFDCKNTASFHWASCLHLTDTSGADLIQQDESKGFQGKFTVYAIGSTVVKDVEWIKSDMPPMVSTIRSEPEEIIKDMNRAFEPKYSNPRIRCNAFMEEDLSSE